MRGVTARELAGAQINANEGGRGEEWRGAVLSDKGSPITERPASLFRRLAAQAAPWGPRSLSALQSPPLSQRGGGSAPRLLPRRGGRRWHRLLRRGTKVPTAACGRKCPALGKEGRRVQCGGGAEPRASPASPGQPPAPPHPRPPHLRAAQRPAPGPWPGHPGLQPWGLRSGEGHLWWFAWRGRGEGEGRSPKWAWRRA